ncbi:MAG: hypothetical protein ACFB12_01805 [Leptolyngbyaceae cyanobacterium]
MMLWSQYRRFLAKRRSANDGEAGLTLLECLAAIVVVGLMGAAIAPVLVLSVATRVQSQKAEQALALAQGEIDRIRVLLEEGSNDSINLALADLPASPAGNIDNTAAPAAPATPVTDPANLDAVTKTLAKDIDGDGTPDFAVQRFRGQVGTLTDGFYVGVRVYDYRAITEGSNLGIEGASVGMTATSGERLNEPLATLYTSVFDTAEGAALCNYIDFSAPAGGNPTDKAKPIGCN